MKRGMIALLALFALVLVADTAEAQYRRGRYNSWYNYSPSYYRSSYYPSSSYWGSGYYPRYSSSYYYNPGTYYSGYRSYYPGSYYNPGNYYYPGSGFSINAGPVQFYWGR